jgi:hypothetical protein
MKKFYVIKNKILINFYLNLVMVIWENILIYYKNYVIKYKSIIKF